MSFSSLLAQAMFMRSGSHTMLTLYPPWLDFSDSLRTSSSLSPAVMIACWFSAPIAVVHSSIEK